MGIEALPDRIVFDGIIRDVSRSLIPQVYIVSVESSEIKAVFDLHRSLKELKVNDRVRITLSKSRPEYRDGVDLVLRGYVMSKRVSEDRAAKLLISLWGYLLTVETSSTEVLKLFNYMDEVYFKLEVL